MRPFFVLLLIVLSPLESIAAKPRAGDKVFLKPNAEATVDGMKVDIKVVPVPATIVVVEGEMLSLGKAWVRKSDIMLPEEAFEFFSAQIHSNPADASAWKNRGLVRIEMGKRNSALDDFEQVILLEPENSMVYVYWGEVKRDEGHHEEAIVNFDEAIKLDPQNARAYFDRGQVRLEVAFAKDQLDMAIKDWENAIRIDPDLIELDLDYTTYYSRLAMLSMLRGDNDEAITAWTNLIELTPNNPKGYSERARLLFLKGEIASATKDLDEVIRLNPTDADAYTTRAQNERIVGDLEGAIRDQTESIKLRPKVSSKYCDRAGTWCQKGEYKNAIQDYEKALEINAESAPAYDGLAWIRAACPVDHYRNGKEAIELAKKACELMDKKQKFWHYQVLASAYAEADDFENAVNFQQKYVEHETVKALLAWCKDAAAKGNNDLFKLELEEHLRADERLKLYQAGKPYRTESKK